MLVLHHDSAGKVVILDDKRSPGRIVITKKSGIFYRADRGGSWTRAVTNITAEDDFAFYRLYTSKKKSKRIFAITGLMPNDDYTDYNSLNTSTHKKLNELKGGLYKSIDGGRNWKIIASCRKRIYAGLADVALSKKGTLYIAVTDFSASDAMGGLFNSIDGGKSWTDITGKAALNRYTRIVIDPFNQRKIYLGTYGAGAFMRTDQD